MLLLRANVLAKRSQRCAGPLLVWKTIAQFPQTKGLHPVHPCTRFQSAPSGGPSHHSRISPLGLDWRRRKSFFHGQRINHRHRARAGPNIQPYKNYRPKKGLALPQRHAGPMCCRRLPLALIAAKPSHSVWARSCRCYVLSRPLRGTPAAFDPAHPTQRVPAPRPESPPAAQPHQASRRQRDSRVAPRTNDPPRTGTPYCPALHCRRCTAPCAGVLAHVADVYRHRKLAQPLDNPLIFISEGQGRHPSPAGKLPTGAPIALALGLCPPLRSLTS